MAETVVLTYENPPIPDRNHDWGAYFDGRAEDGIKGWGSTKLAAALDLWNHAETPEEVIAVILAVLRADLDTTGKGEHLHRPGMERAIRCIEGFE